MPRPALPARGLASDEIVASLEARAQTDVDYKGGRTWSLVYWVNDAHHALCERAQSLFMDTNALNPMAFRSLKQMEHEVVQMTAGLLNAPDTAVGTMTTGGTESLLLAVKTYRDRARRKRPWVLRPNMVVPASIHVAFDKACHYFGVKKKVAPVLDDGRVDVDAMARLVDRQTVMLACSAPQYPWGSIDPVAEVGALAERHGLPLHVDACFGGFMLPWLERLGRPIPPWDFRVPAVTSVSADLHKYGYAPKGSSVIVYRDMEHLKDQFFVAAGWSGGVYVSPSIPGTRSGGAIASAWTSLMALGEEGFMALARGAWETSERLRADISKIEGLRLLGRPDATIVTWASADPAIDLFAVADQMVVRGWAVDRQQGPPSVHMTVNANNAPVVPRYVQDLAASVAEVRANPGLRKEGEAAVYGLMAKIPMKGLVEREVMKVMEKMYAADGGDDPLSSAGDSKLNDLVDKYGDVVFGALDRVRGWRDAMLSGARRVRRWRRP